MRCRPSQHSAAGCDLNRSNAPAVEHDESITVFAAQHARILGKRRDDVFYDLIFVGDVGLFVRDIDAVAGDESDPQYCGRHVVN